MTAQRSIATNNPSGNQNEDKVEAFLKSYYKMSSSTSSKRGADDKELDDRKRKAMRRIELDEDDNNPVLFGGGVGSLGANSSQMISNSMIFE